MTASLIAQAMRQEMLDGAYVPGQRLIEDDIARRYSSSRSIVRRALDEMAAERLVDQVPNRGARLRQLSVSTAIQLYTARGALDSLIATCAAGRTTIRDARRLGSLREDVVRAAANDDVGRFSRLRSACTGLLSEISGQEEAGSLAERATGQLWWYRRRLALGPRPPRIAAKDMVALIDAVRTRDIPAAQDAVSSHISVVCAALHAHDFPAGQYPRG